MVELHNIVKEELSKAIREYNQGHLESQLRKLFENVLKDEHAEGDIINLIENVQLSETEGSDD